MTPELNEPEPTFISTGDVEPQPDEMPAIIAYYQQQLANAQYKVAVMSVQLAKAHGRLQFAYQDNLRLEKENEIIRGATVKTDDEKGSA